MYSIILKTTNKVTGERTYHLRALDGSVSTVDGPALDALIAQKLIVRSLGEFELAVQLSKLTEEQLRERLKASQKSASRCTPNSFAWKRHDYVNSMIEGEFARRNGKGRA